MKELNSIVAKEGLFAEWWKVERKFWFFLNFWGSLPIILTKYLRQLYYRKILILCQRFWGPSTYSMRSFMVDMYGGVTCLSEHLIEKIIQLMSREQRNAKHSTKFYTKVTPTIPFFDTSILIPVYYLGHQTFNPYPFKGHWRSNLSVGEWC